MIEVLGVLMGVDIQAGTRPEGSDELPEGVSKEPPSASSPPPQASSSSKPSQPTPPAQEDVEMEEDDEEAQAKKKALSYKDAGAAAYKKRDFPEAIKNFDLAWETWPKDISFLTNLGGTFISDFISTAKYSRYLYHSCLLRAG